MIVLFTGFCWWPLYADNYGFWVDDDVFVGGERGFALHSDNGYEIIQTGGEIRGEYSRVNAIVSYHGDIIVGGLYRQIADLHTENIARWDHQKWYPMGSGVDFKVRSLAVYQDKLVAGGAFEMADGQPAKFIAFWDGSVWSALPGEFNGSVQCLAADDNYLYVGGWFTRIDDLTVNRIARWDGKEWSGLGDGFNAIVNDIQVHAGAVYAGGSFTSSGSDPVQKIAVWNGETWINAGTGFLGDVNVIEFVSDKMFAGGDFNWIKGVDDRVACIYMFADGLWQPLWDTPPTGDSMPVTGLHVRQNILYIGDRYYFGYGRWRDPDAATPFERITKGELAIRMYESTGLSWGDYDGDGYEDLLEGDTIYRNNRDGSFQPVPGSPVTLHYGDCSSWIDFDNDGDQDLYSTRRYTTSNFFKNKGDALYLYTDHALLNNPSGIYSHSWVDFNSDGLLDLYLVYYGLNDVLYQNLGDEYFGKVSGISPVKDQTHMLTSSWADIDSDGDMDLFECSGALHETNRLYINQGAGKFSRVDGDDPVMEGEWSRVAAFGDADNDGDVDLYVANLGGPDFFYLNRGDGTFQKVTDGELVKSHGDSEGCTWCDFDNDGDLDLFVFGGRNSVNRVYENQGNAEFVRRYDNEAAFFEGESYGGAWCDYDRDGDPDLVVGNKGKNFVLRNKGDANHWLTLDLQGVQSNRDAIGATVRLKAVISGKPVWQMRQHFRHMGCFQQTRLIAFGLGDALVADSLVIEWPSGIVQILTGVQADQFLNLVEAVTVNRKPNARKDVVTIVQNQTRRLYVMSNDSDPDGDLLSLEVILGDSLSGTALMTQDRQAVDYTPSPGFSGTDMFYYVLSDGAGGLDTAKVTIQVVSANRPPVAVNDTLSGTGNVSLMMYVLANDMDPDADSLRINSIDTTGTLGFVQIEPGSRSLLYIPLMNFTGPDCLKYILADTEGAMDTACVYIVIHAGNHPPLAVNDTIFVSESGVQPVDVLANDTDPDGDRIRILSADQVEETAGTLVIQGDTLIFYRPAEGFNGQFDFDYIVADDKDGSDTASVFITVERLTLVESAEILPSVYSLYQNHPNPFNPSTRIRYDLPATAEVRLTVCDILGQDVSRLVRSRQSAGQYETLWNGCDDRGAQVPSGIYLVRMQAGAYTSVRKMMLVR